VTSVRDSSLRSAPAQVRFAGYSPRLAHSATNLKLENIARRAEEGHQASRPAYKYPARLRKDAVRASFPFFGLPFSESQRPSVWRFTPISEATSCSVLPHCSRYRFNALISSSGLTTSFPGQSIFPFPAQRSGIYINGSPDKSDAGSPFRFGICALAISLIRPSIRYFDCSS
jgi:hypothetical protein